MIERHRNAAILVPQQPPVMEYYQRYVNKLVDGLFDGEIRNKAEFAQTAGDSVF